MKKTIYSFMALASLAMVATSCSSDFTEENVAENNKKIEMTFEATQEIPGADSRTSIAEDTYIKWTKNTDLITVWDGKEKTEFTVARVSGGINATLSGEVSKQSSSYIALYPNSVGANCTYSAAKIDGVVIPQSQNATSKSFDPAAAIMTAVTDADNKLAFKNVCSFLKITIPNSSNNKYAKIVVSVETGNIAGTFSVNPSTGVATVTNGAKSITITKDGSATLDKNKIYYIAIAPGAVTNFNIKCYNSAGTDVQVEKTKDQFTFARSAVYDLGTME